MQSLEPPFKTQQLSEESIEWILGGTFDVAEKEQSLASITQQLSEESTWSDLELSQSLNKQKAEIEKFLNHFLDTESQLADNLEILEMAVEENDASGH